MNEQTAVRFREIIYLYLWANQGALVLAGLSSVDLASKLFNDIAQEMVLALQLERIEP